MQNRTLLNFQLDETNHIILKFLNGNVKMQLQEDLQELFFEGHNKQHLQLNQFQNKHPYTKQLYRVIKAQNYFKDLKNIFYLLFRSEDFGKIGVNLLKFSIDYLINFW